MVKSMTGYGRCELEVQDQRITVEMRAVNHRFCEISLRMPRHFLFLEERLKKVIQQRVTRGRIEVFITCQTMKPPKKKLMIDQELAKVYLEMIQALQSNLQIEGKLTIQDMLQLPELFIVEELEGELDECSEALVQAVQHSTDHLVQMREIEGLALVRDLELRLTEIEGKMKSIKSFAPQVKESYRSRLESSIRELLHPQFEWDETRLVTEVALFAEKANIDEEITRLQSHCDQFQTILHTDDAVGRKLDFLIQEMNREVNTIGSKANHLGISQHVVDLKSVIEKMKEQVQNIE